MKLYLAAPIFNPTQVDVVETMQALAEGLGHETFSPYHNSRNIFGGRKPADCTEEERAMVLYDNITNIDWAEGVLCWVGGMGGFTDPGVVWEMGYGYAKQKLIVGFLDETLDAQRQSMNLMLSGTMQALGLGTQALGNMLRLMADGNLSRLIESYHPALLLGAEMDPVV